jgi:hypothetical protein
MARITLVVVVFAGLLAGCGSLSALRGGDSTHLSASIGDKLEPLAGHWQGLFSATGGWYYQGTVPLDPTIKPDGTWTGTIGGAKASGTAKLKGRNLVLEGTARSATGHEHPVYLSLTGDEARRWGATMARFGEREEHASVSLRKVS